MKLLKILLVFFFALNVAYAKDKEKVLAFAYNFPAGGSVEFTSSSFVAYGDKFENIKAMDFLHTALFASDDKLSEVLLDEKDLALAKKILSGIGDSSKLKASYVIFDGSDTIVLLGDSFMLFDKNLKWNLSKTSPLYTYLAKNAKDAKFLGGDCKKSKKIELCDAVSDIVDPKNEDKLGEYEPFAVYIEAYDAFYAKNFESFTVFLDSDGADAFSDKIGEASNEDEIAEALGDELKDNRVYQSVANLGGSFIVFFTENKGKDLKFECFRDIGCGIELVNYGRELEPVMLDFISR